MLLTLKENKTKDYLLTYLGVEVIFILLQSLSGYVLSPMHFVLLWIRNFDLDLPNIFDRSSSHGMVN